MSEKVIEKNTEKAPKKEGKNNVVKAREEVKRTEKTPWTIERCTKYARRFSNESVWASASPASYKSAVAHGWRDQCLEQMKSTTGKANKVIAGNFKNQASSHSHKKAA